jgi:hypothetical protein
MNDDEFLTIADEAIQYLKAVEYTEYHESKLPCHIDEEITTLCVKLMKASSTQRQIFASALDLSATYILLKYAGRMSMLSVRQRSNTLLMYGLVSLSMIGDRADLNWDDYMILVLLYHSAIKLGDPVQLFHESAQYAPDERARKFILHFLDREPEDQRLAAFGYREIEGPSGLIYQFGKMPIPKGLL